MRTFRFFGGSTPVAGEVLAWPFFFALLATSLQAQKTSAGPAGLAWEVQGTWRLEGKDVPVRTGDAVQPGSLLQAAEETAGHSITVLLPDGQRILYECLYFEFVADRQLAGLKRPSLAFGRHICCLKLE